MDKPRFFTLLFIVPILFTTSCFVIPSPDGLTIGDTVWLDDGDGIFEDGEEGLPGIQVRLFEVDGESPIRETTTDAEGNYAFNNLESGDYFLEFNAPEEFRLTLKDRGDDDETDSDPDPNTNRTERFAVNADDSQDHWDAGFVPLDIPLQTPTPTGELVLHVPTVMATDTPAPSATPTPDNVNRFEDEEGDVVTCENQEPIDDPNADIKEVEIETDEVQTRLVRLILAGSPQNPRESEYSYAAGVHINPGQQALEFYWQVHSGQEDHKGDFAWVPYPLPNGEQMLVPEFRIPAEELPEEINRIQVGMFHMGSQDSDCASDELVIENPG